VANLIGHNVLALEITALGVVMLKTAIWTTITERRRIMALKGAEYSKRNTLACAYSAGFRGSVAEAPIIASGLYPASVYW
jgi:hypothetical protein